MSIFLGIVVILSALVLVLTVLFQSSNAKGLGAIAGEAETYFGKELQSLTLAECASLISITNNPSLFDPYSTKEFKYAGEMMNGMQRLSLDIRKRR